MIFDVRHITKIRYAALIRLARFNLRLRPASWPGQHVSDYQLAVTPKPSTCVTEEGPYVVNISRLMLGDPIVELTIESSFSVDVTPAQPPEAAATPSLAVLRQSVLARRGLSKFGPAPYLYPSLITQIEPEIAHWATPLLEKAETVMDAGISLMRAIHDGFEYDTEATEAGTLPLEAFRKRRGVCQDFAHIMTAIARSWGIPCRYVSGYLYHKGAHDRSAANATHAWVEAYLPSLGWVGFDPTNNIMGGERHIRAAVGRDYADVPPTRGTYKGSADSELSIAVLLEPTAAPVRHEDFLRVARPMASQRSEEHTSELQSH